MRLFLPFCLAGLMFSAVAAADITDLRELESGSQPAIFIGFEDAPEMLASRVNGRVIELELAGQRAGSRRIEAAGGRWIEAIEALPSETGQLIRIELPDGADGLEILPTESGYRLSWISIAGEGSGSGTAGSEPVDPAEDRVAEASLSGTIPDNSSSGGTAAQAGETVPDATIHAAQGDDACAQASGVVERDPWDIDALTRHAECLLAAGQAEDATLLLERVIAFEPGRFDAVIALAEAHQARGDMDAARALYEQAATVAATDGQAVAARARARALSN